MIPINVISSEVLLNVCSTQISYLVKCALSPVCFLPKFWLCCLASSLWDEGPLVSQGSASNLFLRNLFKGRIDSTFLLRSFSLAAPIRVGRQLSLFQVPFARVCTVRDGLFTRAPRLANDFLRASPTADLFHDGFRMFRSSVISHVSGLCVIDL